MSAPLMLCAYSISAHGFNKKPQKLVTWNEPSGSRAYATGCCIHAFAVMIKNPESHEPAKTMNAAHQCCTWLRRLSPNKNNPRNADSRKNEKTPSITRGWPMTPPVSREKCDQFVPN